MVANEEVSFTTLIHRGSLIYLDEARNTENSDEKKCILPVFLPWHPVYSFWWGCTVLASLLTLYFETYQIGFSSFKKYPPEDTLVVFFEFTLIAIFVVDIAINFNLACAEDGKKPITSRIEIARSYFKSNFWIDVIGVFPWYLTALVICGEYGKDDSKLGSYLSLVRLVRLVRLRRVKELFENLNFNSSINILHLTLLRNFGFLLVWTHLNACIFYFIASHGDYSEETWIGAVHSSLDESEQYFTSLYWSVVTFTTVGYGDFSPNNTAEQIWAMMYMLVNIIFQAWVIGSITLLIVRADEKTGSYREAVGNLVLFSESNNFERPLVKELKDHITLVHNREISDEQVLRDFPSAVRKRLLRKMYLPSIIQSSLMKEVDDRFLDEFLSSCRVESFPPRYEIMHYGSCATELYLLISGRLEVLSKRSRKYDEEGAFGAGKGNIMRKKVEHHDFINAVSFFTDSQNMETVKTSTVCKMLVISRSQYKLITENDPCSAAKILQNLLDKVENSSIRNVPSFSMDLDDGDSSGTLEFEFMTQSARHFSKERNDTSIQCLVEKERNRQRHDQAQRLLRAASNEDFQVVRFMCEQNFDPNGTDYDKRTALMVASMRGYTKIVSVLLDFDADPNLVDVHGSSALHEAVLNGHEDTMNLLLIHDATLRIDEQLAASRLCHCISNGDISLMKRYLKAKIHVNATDYNKRTAAHFACTEENLVALKILIEFGADLSIEDRWGNTVLDDAKRSNSTVVLGFFERMHNAKPKPSSMNGKSHRKPLHKISNRQPLPQAFD